MSRPTVTAVAACTLFISVGYVLTKRRVGDVRPVIFPPQQDLAEVIEKRQPGELVEIPLTLSDDFQIGVFTKNLGKPRDLELSPGGTILVSLPESGQVVALPDQDGDGQSDEIKTLLTNLQKPHGLAF